MTPAQAAAALADLSIADTLATALATQTQRLAETIRASLATPPGGPHDRPWRQTGTLQASIAISTDALSARIGSTDPAAAPQEFGTIRDPPRPLPRPRRRSRRRARRPRHRPGPRRHPRTPPDIGAP